MANLRSCESDTDEQEEGKTLLVVGESPDNVHNEGDNNIKRDDDSVTDQHEVMNDHPEPQNKQPPEFELPSNEKKVGFTFR